jgi:hypothetical protein
MMHAVRRDDETHRADRVELRAQSRVEHDRRVQQEAAVGEPDHRHPGADFESVEALRALDHPKVGGKLS